MWSRFAAAFSLFLLSPLIAEYLLGSLPMSMIVILPVMALMYGGGAVVIRELVRRTGRGWPSIILLATAYGLIEEGLVDQSLFNPNYLHLRLLDYGFVPALGTSLVWAIYVIALHMFWSISVPIGMTESLFKNKRDTPWLGTIGLVVFGLLYLAGATLVFVFTNKSLPFMASPAQLGGTAALVVVLVIAAFAWPKPHATGGKAPQPMLLFSVPLVLGSAFILSEFFAPGLHLAPAVAAALLFGLEALMCLFMLVFTRGKAWSDVQRFALMAGGLSVYIWCGFKTDFTLHGVADLPAHTVIAVLFVALLLFAGWRSTKVPKAAVTDTH